jgi:ATP-dependent helicase HepA
MAEEILGRVPADLDAATERVVVGAAERLGLFVERGRGRRVYSVEFGSSALVDSLPGLAGDASFLGTFDREEAVADETLDFFAFGHPLVEGLLEDLEESARGRVCAIRLTHADGPSVGLLAAYRSEGRLDLVVLDRAGRRRDDWRGALVSGPLEPVVDADVLHNEGWGELVRRIAAHLDDTHVPVALAAVLVDRGPKAG